MISSTNTVLAAWLLALALAPTARSQNNLYISPPYLANAEGTHSSSIPFDRAQPTRYLQIHTDTAEMVMNLRRLSFRQNGGTGTFQGVRSMSLELLLGHARQYDHVQGLEFIANYTSARTLAIARKTVNFGPQGAAAPSAGSEFNMHLVLDQPYAYDGRSYRSLAWEVLVHSNSLTGMFNALDAEIGTPSLTSGTVSVTGSGCTASGASAPLVQSLTVGSTGESLVLGWSLANAPPNVPAALALGSLNPNAAVPGLCSNLQTNLLLTLGMGVTDAQGRIPLGGPGTWIIENHWDELPLFSQFHVGDLALSSPLKIANSNGLRLLVPRSNRSRVARMTRFWNEDGTTTATRAVFQVSGMADCGLVVRFTY